MGKSGKKARKAGKQTSTRPARSRAQTKKAITKAGVSFSVEDLLVKIDDLIETFEFEAAKQFCERALSLDGQHPRLLETTAAILLELGDVEQAHELLCRAVDVEPDRGHTKFMYLAQLTGGVEAAKHYKCGLQIMEQVFSGPGKEGVCGEDISTAYCSLAELYLTDLCFEEDALAQCQHNLSSALQFWPENPEAIQLMASCEMSQGHTAEARQYIVSSVRLWLPPESEGDQAAAAAAAAEGGASPPPYMTRVAAAKILIEVEEFELAFAVLEGLLEDDDEVVQVWYLSGWAHFLCKESSAARLYLEKAKEMYSKTDCDDVAMMEHVEELLSEIGPEVDDDEENGPEEENEDGEEHMDVGS